jgi:pimeloyl-ACP methyl ester carboxylesterase
VWDDQNPVHFVGHSAGAQVVRVLQQKLADKVHTAHFSKFIQKPSLFVAGRYCAHAYHMLPEGWFL